MPPSHPFRRASLDGVKVALVYTPYGAIRNEPGIKVVKDNYGVFPSLSLLYVAGVAEAAGCEVLFIDAHAEGLTVDQTVQRLRAFGPDFIGYTVTTYLFFQNLEWIRAIKKALPVPVIVGGVHLGIYPKETLLQDAIDYGVTGEAEWTLPDLLHALVTGGDLSGIPGVAYKPGGDAGPEGSLVRVNPAVNQLEVDLAPFPARHLIDNSLYYSFISQYKNFTPIITSRGCPFRCIFCEQGAVRFRPRTPANVGDELELCVREHGVRELDFFDSSFTIQKKRVMAICEEIERRKLDIVWAMRSRVDCVDREMLRAIRRAGCTRIYYGVESGNREILRVLRKATDLDQIRRVIRETRQEGIHAFGYFMVGMPLEDAGTIRQTIRLARELELDYAQFSKVTPMPATELYAMLMEETGRDWWREFMLSGQEVEVPRPRCSLTEAEVERWIRLAYLRFYFRPSYVMRALRRVQSWDEFVRSARTAAQMALTPPGDHDDTGMEVHD
jgi:anaerobic magnesium-protoporphyrin IX monomethyl ester cyclase